MLFLLSQGDDKRNNEELSKATKASASSSLLHGTFMPVRPQRQRISLFIENAKQFSHISDDKKATDLKLHRNE